MKETRKGNDGLLDFGFLVRDMLASLGIELDDFDLFRRSPLVFGRSIEMTGTRGGFQFDFFSACFSHNKNLSKKEPKIGLDFFAASAKIGENGIDTELVDDTQAGIGDAKRNPAVFGLDEEAAVMQIGHKAPFGLVIGMRNRITGHGFFTCDLANASHKNLRNKKSEGCILYERKTKDKKKQ